MPKKHKKNEKTTLIAGAVVLVCFIIFSFVAVSMINRQSFDTRSDASSGDAQAAALTQMKIQYTDPIRNHQYRDANIAGGGHYYGTYDEQQGMLKIVLGNLTNNISWVTPGWDKVIIFKVNGVEKLRQNLSSNAHFIVVSYSPNNGQSTYGPTNARFSVAVNLKKVVDGYVYTCRYDGVMLRNPVGNNNDQTIVSGASCVNLGEKSIFLAIP